MKPGDSALISWRRLAVLCLDYKCCPPGVGKVGWKDVKRELDGTGDGCQELNKADDELCFTE